MMETKVLTADQVREIYKEHLTQDFPPLERRSLNMLLSKMAKDEYTCLGMFEADELLGYAFFICHGKDLMIDYFAIVDEQRNHGLGSIFLGLIQDHFRDADSLIAEIEDPDFACTEEEKSLREHRKGFYERNGFRDTGAKVRSFGVRFRLIECGRNTHSAEEIKDIYARHYQLLLPEKIYRKVIRF